MIENELRSLLTDRATTVRDNPARAAEVRSRVRTIRRRRGVGAAALVLVLLAIAGAVLTRLPGRPDALPPANPTVPAPPYFLDDGRARQLDGYQMPARDTFTGPAASFTTVTAIHPDVRWLLTVRCARAGVLAVRARDVDASGEVPCRTRIGDHYEGLRLLEPDAAMRLFAAGGVLILTPSTAGSWAFATHESMFPDRLPPVERVGRQPLLEGPDHPGGGTVPVVVPRDLVLQIQVGCVRGVALRFLVGEAELAVARCEPQVAVGNGQFVVLVPPERATAVGLRAGERVSLTVRPDGGPAGQWRVIVAGP